MENRPRNLYAKAMTQEVKSDGAWPTTARELLEKRYEAFRTGNTDYVVETHHPETRDQLDRDAVESWSKQSSWKGLEIEDVEEEGDKCFIRFTVRYERKHELIPHTELAEFRKEDGKWFYYDSEFPSPETVRREGEKLGRNDPCSCGSNKKYKKCCGKAA